MKKKKLLVSIPGIGLAVLGILLLASCSSSGSGSPVTPPASQTFGSTTSVGHTHSVTVNRSEIESPPTAGIARDTSSNSGHTHSFAMTRDQLLAVASGTTVTITTGPATADNHTHNFSISKWF